MPRIAYLKAPRECSDEEKLEFERLVREGFGGSDETLPDRIMQAWHLAFLRDEDGRVEGIAGLKAPGWSYRRDVFQAAGAEDADPAAYDLELGWVFVLPEVRGNHLAADLCRKLISRVSESAVFATTRPGNRPMERILARLGFIRAGTPFPGRNEELRLFLRAGADRMAGGAESKRPENGSRTRKV